MLLEFSAENFRSLRDPQALDLRTSATRDLAEVVRHPAGMDAESRGVLPVAAVFGANASGKSSLFMAADYMRTAVLNSASSAVEGAGVLEQVISFRFDATRRDSPVTLQIHFLLAGIRHEYGFSLQPRSATHRFTSVASEWLRAWPHGRASDLFLRGQAVMSAGHTGRWWVSEQGFHGGRRLAGDLFEQTRDDVLFLSLASQRNHPSAKAVVTWFNEQLCTYGSHAWEYSRYHAERKAGSDAAFLAYLGSLLRAVDTGIERVEVSIDEEDDTPEEMKGLFGMRGRANPRFITRTLHRTQDGRELALNLHEESAGTQRLFVLAGPIHDALQHGRCLWIDELDTAMHHWLVRTLIKLFQDPQSNPNGAQLLFTTHDAAVMDPTLLRRDQIWIVEKDAAQASQLFSLVDIDEKPRKGQPLFKSFLSGRFGGVPRLDEAAILAWPRSPK